MIRIVGAVFIVIGVFTILYSINYYKQKDTGEWWKYGLPRDISTGVLLIILGIAMLLDSFNFSMYIYNCKRFE